MDRTDNSREMVMYEIEYNLYYKGHMKQVKIDVCNLGRIEVILGIPRLAAHNPKIN